MPTSLILGGVGGALIVAAIGLALFFYLRIKNKSRQEVLLKAAEAEAADPTFDESFQNDLRKHKVEEGAAG